MSNATKQSLTILSVISGGLRAALQCFDTGPEIAQILTDAKHSAEQVVQSWTITGDELEHQQYAAAKLAEWEEYLRQQPTDKWTILANLSVSVILLDDLYQQTRQSAKKEILSSLFGPVMASHDYVAPRWNGEVDYDFAQQCVAALYSIIGFDPAALRRAA